MVCSCIEMIVAFPVGERGLPGVRVNLPQRQAPLRKCANIAAATQQHAFAATNNLELNPRPDIVVTWPPPRQLKSGLFLTLKEVALIRLYNMRCAFRPLGEGWLSGCSPAGLELVHYRITARGQEALADIRLDELPSALGSMFGSAYD